MRKRRVLQSVLGAAAVLVLSLLGTVPVSQAAGPVNFYATDEPGPWFKCVGNGCVPAATQSLALSPQIPRS